MRNDTFELVPQKSFLGRSIKAIRKKQNKKKQFSIIANNCWGFQIYNWLDLPYQTPFVGCGAYPPCYLKLLSDLKYFLRQDFSQFLNESRYFHGPSPWPIGLLGGEIEIHFAHYQTAEEAEVSWKKRIGRMNWHPDDIYVKICDRDSCNETDLKQFHQLPFRNKISFTATAHPELHHNVQIEVPSGEHQVMRADYLFEEGSKYFDVFHWINQNEIKMTPTQVLVNLLTRRKKQTL